MSVNEYLNLVALKIRGLRVENGFTQLHASSLISVSLRKYQRLESGESIPSLEDIIKLAHIFNVDVKDFMASSTSKNACENKIHFPKIA